MSLYEDHEFEQFLVAHANKDMTPSGPSGFGGPVRESVRWANFLYTPKISRETFVIGAEQCLVTLCRVTADTFGRS